MLLHVNVCCNLFDWLIKVSEYISKGDHSEL